MPRPTSQADTPAVTVQPLALPKGGGALRGMSDSVAAQEFTGTASWSLPLPATPCRGFEPRLGVEYHSGNGHGVFGLGYALSLSAITRRTSLGTPRYDDSDVFVLDGEQLVPVDGGPVLRASGAATFSVTRFHRRSESSFARIERIVPVSAGTPDPVNAFWRVIGRDNSLTIFGRTSQARVVDPEDPSRVFKWLIEEVYDARGNRRSYVYKREDFSAGDLSPVFERGRSHTANVYLERVRYGNDKPDTLSPAERSGLETPPPNVPAPAWHFEIVFDYGEYDVQTSNDTPYASVRPWTERADPFSTYDAGFERRTHRLCRHALLFHRFAELGPEPVLVHVTRFTYDESPSVTLLTRVDAIGWRRDGGAYRSKPLPPLEIEYVPFTPTAGTFVPLRSADGANLIGVQGHDYQLADLDGVGVPGILYDDGPSVLFRAAQAAAPGQDLLVTYGALCAPVAFPSATAEGGPHFMDVTGDGMLDLVRTAAPAGFFANHGDGEWGAFQPFASIPSEWMTAATEFVDMTGSGAPGVAVIDAEVVRFYPSLGASGFGPASETPRQNAVPVTQQDWPQEVLRFADLLGAGRHQRVRIRSGEAICWPHLGYGRYGRPVVMAGAPSFGEDMDAARVFLADLDGSGTLDLCYLRTGTIDVYRNLSGNAFASEPLILTLPAPCFSPEQVTFADVLGTGYECLVFSDGLPSPQYWVYDFCQQRKPYLLSVIRNNCGGETRLTFGSSTRFALLDQKADTPWVTQLPFPVQVLVSIETRDAISKTSQLRSYAYHHGFFDPVEREFRGFGLVERSDTEILLEAPAVAESSDLPSTPPAFVRTWYHTGAWGDAAARLLSSLDHDRFQGDPLARKPAPPSLDGIGTDPETLRQANVVLHAAPLREELYALGPGSTPEHPGVPVTVTDHVPLVRLVQDRGAVGLAAFFVHPRETLHYVYEGVADDPRVGHDVTLEIDEVGNVTRAGTVAYPRRSGAADAVDAQLTTTATCDVAIYVPAHDEEDELRLGLPQETKHLEIAGWGQPDVDGRYYSVDAIATQMSTEASARLRGWRRHYYTSDEGAEAPLGTASTQALLRRTEQAEAAERDLHAVLDGTPIGTQLAVTLARGGYVLANGYWWNPGSSLVYSAAGDDRFFLPLSVTDAFGTVISCQYDPYNLLPVATRVQAAGVLDTTTAFPAIDYQALQPLRMVDANGIASEIVTDPLGQVIASSRYKTGDEGFTPLDRYQHVDLASPADIVGNPPAFLQGAAAFGHVDLLSWCGSIAPDALTDLDTGGLWDDLAARRYVSAEGAILSAFRALPEASTFVLSPPHAANAAAIYARIAAAPHAVPVTRVTLAAEVFPVAGTPTKPGGAIQVQVAYLDGMQRVVQALQLVEDGEGFRWRSSGRVRFNDKGQPYRQYEPYFVSTWRFADDDELATRGVTATLHYDALGRVVRTDLPRGGSTTMGVFDRTEYGAWRTTHWDAADTINDSEYRAELTSRVAVDPLELDAVEKSLPFHDTPTIQLLDNMGRGVRTVAFAAAGVPLTSTVALDIDGRALWSADPRLFAGGVRNFEHTYSLGGQILKTVSADAGTCYALQNVAGKPLSAVDARGFVTTWTYDGLQRSTLVRVQGGDGAQPLDHIIERTVYGDSLDTAGQPPVDRPEATNLRGAAYVQYDRAGRTEAPSYTIGGLPRETHLRCREAYQGEAHWDAEPASWKDVFAALETALMSEPAAPGYVSRMAYDALNRPVQWTDPGGNVQARTYHPSGPIKTAILNGTTISTASEHNARGQRLLTTLGNGVTLHYTYQPDTFRLKRLIAIRTGDNLPLQDLTYYYDPVGNVTHVQDRSSFAAAVFNNNQQVTADGDYTYDALYRLVASKGRCHTGLTDASEQRGDYARFFPATAASLNDGTALERYERRYTYDTGSNLVAMQHLSSAPWTRTFTLDATSNRAILTDKSPNPPLAASFDASGNLIHLTGAAGVQWNCRNALQSITFVDRPHGTPDAEYYVYDRSSLRQRKVTQTVANGNGIQIEETLYWAGFEIFRRRQGGRIVEERRRVRVLDDGGCAAEWLQWTVSPPGPTRPSTYRYQLTNQQQSAQVELDEQGRLISYEEYAPYGATTYAAGSTLAEVSLKQYRYSGKELDSRSGLYYYGFRYYAPWLARWLNPDPAGPLDGPNLYEFASSNPTTGVDAMGLCKNNNNDNNNHHNNDDDVDMGVDDTSTNDNNNNYNNNDNNNDVIPKEPTNTHDTRPNKHLPKEQRTLTSGWYKSKDVDYPAERVIYLVVQSLTDQGRAQDAAYALTVHEALWGRTMPSENRQKYLADLTNGRKRFLTAEDLRMQAAPGQSMRDEKISLDHRLSDSAIRGLVCGLWIEIWRNGLDGNQEEALDNFVGALTDTPAEFQTVLALFAEAVNAPTLEAAANSLTTAIDIMSNSNKNVRFGNATVNGKVNYLFDPNEHQNGAMTPRSTSITSAVAGLNVILPDEVCQAALTRAILKATGQPMRSSTAQGKAA